MNRFLHVISEIAFDLIGVPIVLTLFFAFVILALAFVLAFAIISAPGTILVMPFYLLIKYAFTGHNGFGEEVEE